MINNDKLKSALNFVNPTITNKQATNTNDTPSKIEFDMLRMYFREPYVIHKDGFSDITLLQPTIGDIIDIYESVFYQTLMIFVTNTTANRLMLWNLPKRIDWNEISDYEQFLMFFQSINPKVTPVLFKDLDFSSFRSVHRDTEDGVEWALYNRDQNVLIDEAVYNVIAKYFRTMFNIFPKVEKTLSPYAKESIIEEEEINLFYASKKERPSSTLLPMISSCVNHPGFKYKTSEVRELGVFEFMDSVKRLQIYESSTAIMKGMYSGFVDAKKINADSYNFMRAA